MEIDLHNKKNIINDMFIEASYNRSKYMYRVSESRLFRYVDLFVIATFLQ